MSRHHPVLSPSRAQLAALVLFALVLAAGIAAYGSRSDPDESSTSSGDASEVAAGPRSTTTTVPDELDDPGVGPGECAMVTYTPPTAEDAYEGQLCRPEQDQRDVAVIVVHGGSGVTGSYHGMLGWQRRLLAEGYVTFLPNYHLFTVGSSQSPVFPRPEQNMKAAVQFLRGSANSLGISRDRVVLQGHSAGARIGAVAYATPGNDYFAGDELYDDIPDAVDAFIGFYHPYDATMQFSAQYYGGGPESTDDDVLERWAMADSIANASTARGPALFVTGSEDWSIIDEQQDEFVASLVDTGLDASAVVIDGGAHGFDLGGSRLTRLGEEAATVVLEFLNDVFPQDPEREAQTAPVDLDRAPTGVGETATTLPTRSRSTTSTTWRSGGGSSSGTGAGSPTTSPGSTPTSTETVGSDPDPVPEDTTPVETNPPPNEPAPTTAAPTTAPPPTAPPPDDPIT